MKEPIENDIAIIPYNFEFLINQAEEGDEDNCEFHVELARLLKQRGKRNSTSLGTSRCDQYGD